MILLSTSGRELNFWKFLIISVALFGISSMPDSEAVFVLSEPEMVTSESNWSKSDSDPTRVLLMSELMNGLTSEMGNNEVRESSLDIEIMET